MERQLRQKIKLVLKCDVPLENPFHPVALEPADCTITSLCLKAVCKDLETYQRALRYVSSLLHPGRSLVMVRALGETFYTVGGRRFSCLHLERGNAERILRGLFYHQKSFMFSLLRTAEVILSLTRGLCFSCWLFIKSKVKISHV